MSKTMIPLLLRDLDINDFHCKVCRLIKHHQVPFPSNYNRSSYPFTLIHSDVWDLSNF